MPVVYRGPGTEFRRRHRPRVRHDIVVDGAVVPRGHTVPDTVPLRDVDRLGAHGYVDRSGAGRDDGIDSG